MSLICTSQMNITNTRSTKFKVKAKIKLLISCKLLRTYFFLEKNKLKILNKNQYRSFLLCGCDSEFNHVTMCLQCVRELPWLFHDPGGKANSRVPFQGSTGGQVGWNNIPPQVPANALSDTSNTSISPIGDYMTRLVL